MHDFSYKIFLLLLKKVEKNIYFHSKWLDNLLLITSYLVTIYRKWSSLNFSQNAINEHLLKTSGADVLSSWVMNPRKPKGRWDPPLHPLYVRGLKCYFFEEGKLWQRIDVQPVTPCTKLIIWVSKRLESIKSAIKWCTLTSFTLSLGIKVLKLGEIHKKY